MLYCLKRTDGESRNPVASPEKTVSAESGLLQMILKFTPERSAERFRSVGQNG